MTDLDLARPASRNALEQAILEQLVQLLNQSTRQTELMAELTGLSLNNVLWSGTVTLDAQGVATIDTRATYASFGVWALGSDVTVTDGDAGGAAPGAGVGVFPVPAGGALVWPMVGRTFTIVGTAGDRVIVALWSKPQCPLVANGGGNFDGGGA